MGFASPREKVSSLFSELMYVDVLFSYFVH